MKCPKCGYLGFEEVERCRNCGYDFSVAPAPAGPDLSIRPIDEPAGGDEFALPDVALPRAAAAPPTGTELPLFVGETPLITRPSPPRAPLAVRRSTPDAPRLRTPARTPPLEFAFDERPPDGPPPEAARAPVTPPMPPVAHRHAQPTAAGLAPRLGAVCLDLIILAAVDVAVVYFTLQICGITLDEVALVPKVPLLAFLLVQNLGYLVAFNAGGQTLGKMAMGIRVVPDGESAAIDPGHALVRTLVWVALAVPAGLGFLTALVGRDHRGLHDRFAGTRVVRA
jgi:uncharacterized RDD family membrane protein YckC